MELLKILTFFKNDENIFKEILFYVFKTYDLDKCKDIIDYVIYKLKYTNYNELLCLLIKSGTDESLFAYILCIIPLEEEIEYVKIWTCINKFNINKLNNQKIIR